MRNLGWIVMAASLVGCSAIEEDVAQGEDHLEDAPAPAARSTAKPIPGRLASCAVAAAATVRVSCTDDSAALPAKFLLTISATSARGETKSFRLADPAGAAEFFPESAFPLTLRIRADKDLSRPSDVQGLDALTIEQTIEVSAASELLPVRLPYDFWPVSVRVTADTGLVTVPARPATIAPWLPIGGAATVQLEESGSPLRLAPSRLILAVPTGEKQVPAKIRFGGREIDGAFDGPGTYVVGAAGMSREAEAPSVPAAPPASSFSDVPEELLSCHLGASSPDGHSVVCSTRAVPDVRSIPLSVRILDASGRSTVAHLPAAGDGVLGSCAAEPCTVDVSFQLDVGSAAPLFAATTLPLSGTSSTAPGRVRLPFDVWSVAIAANGQRVLSAEVGADTGTLPAGWTSVDGSSVTFGRGRTTKLDAPLVFAAPIGTTSLGGKLLGIADGRRIDAVVNVERGVRYEVTPAFALVALP